MAIPMGPYLYFFYGSGCSSEISIKKVTSAIKKILPTINIEIQHDLLGAARALYGNGTGIASILGTGASSCLFVNGKILEAVPSLGFLLGDEGSGLHLGRLLLNAFFKKNLPPHLYEAFQKKYKLVLADFISHLYSHPKPNSFIASFVPFMVENKDESAIKELVEAAFDEFINQIILKYSDCHNYELGFVGSVAYLFSDLLTKKADEYGLTIGKIIQTPIEGLVEFHSKGI
jgi:glucosamine kinase